MTETVEKTRREKLAELMDGVRKDEMIAVKELSAYLSGSDAQTFRTKLADLQDRTVPGSHYDAVISAVMSCFDNALSMAQKTITAQAELDEAQERLAAAKAPVPEGEAK